jgi:hypothetical protein
MKQAIGCTSFTSHGEELSCEQYIKLGFEEALYRGLDGFGGESSALLYAGE